MNPEAQEALNKILAKNPETLNTEDIKFLRARRSYLKKSQLEEYDSILNPKVEKKEIKEENQTSEKTEPVKKNGKPQSTN